MEEQVGSALVSEKQMATLLGLFGAMALFLAALGLFGRVSYMVHLRTHEIGIRMALGAAHGDIIRMVVGRGLLLICLGGTIGLPAAAGLTHFLAFALFGVNPFDPLTFAGATILLAAVGLLACYLPARRTAMIDPLAALR